MTGSSAQRAIAGRLREVLDRSGFRSLRAFHEEMKAKGENGFSYTAVLNYHDLDPQKGRMPPVDYLDSVSRLFDVPLAWLVQGTEEEVERAGRAALDGSDVGTDVFHLVKARIPHLNRYLPTIALLLLSHGYRWKQVQARVRPNPPSDEETAEYTERAWELVHEPFRLFGASLGRKVPIDPSTAAANYFTAAIHALNLSLEVAAQAGITPEHAKLWPEADREEKETDHGEA